MKALSIHQPFAELIISGEKVIEVRTWKTDHRGPLMIHATKEVNDGACERLDMDPDELATGALLGTVTLSNVFRYRSLDDFMEHRDEHLGTEESYDEDGAYGWLLANPERFEEPIPYKGQQGLFEVKDLSSKSSQE